MPDIDISASWFFPSQSEIRYTNLALISSRQMHLHKCVHFPRCHHKKNSAFIPTLALSKSGYRSRRYSLLSACFPQAPLVVLYYTPLIWKMQPGNENSYQSALRASSSLPAVFIPRISLLLLFLTNVARILPPLQVVRWIAHLSISAQKSPYSTKETLVLYSLI